MTDLSTLSLKQMAALKAEISAQEKRVKSAAQQRLATFVEGYVEDVLTDDTRTLDYSKASPWVGFSDAGLPVSIDGEDYTVGITVTHVGEKKRREPAHKQAVLSADKQGLKGDERKTFIAEAMKATEPVNA